MRVTGEAVPTPQPSLVQRVELGAIHSGGRLDHPPQASFPPDPGSQAVEVLARRLRIRLLLRTDTNPLAPPAHADRPTDAIAMLPVTLGQAPVPGEPCRLAPAGESPSLLLRDIESDPVRGHLHSKAAATRLTLFLPARASVACQL